MPLYVFKCDEGHETEKIVQCFADSDALMCFHESEHPTVKLLEAAGDRLICGRVARRIDEKSLPAKRASYHGIQT